MAPPLSSGSQVPPLPRVLRPVPRATPPSGKPSPNLPRPLFTSAALVPRAGIVLSFFLSPPFNPQCRPDPHISQSSSSSLQDSSTRKSNPEPQLGRAHCKPQSQLRPSLALNSASCLPSLPSPSALGCAVLAQVFPSAALFIRGLLAPSGPLPQHLPRISGLNFSSAAQAQPSVPSLVPLQICSRLSPTPRT